MNSNDDSVSPWNTHICILASAKLLPTTVNSTLQVFIVFSIKFITLCDILYILRLFIIQLCRVISYGFLTSIQAIHRFFRRILLSFRMRWSMQSNSVCLWILYIILFAPQGTICGLIVRYKSFLLFVLLIFSTSLVGRLWVCSCLDMVPLVGWFWNKVVFPLVIHSGAYAPCRHLFISRASLSWKEVNFLDQQPCIPLDLVFPALYIFASFWVEFLSAFAVEFPILVLIFSSCFVRASQFFHKLISPLHRLVHLIRLYYSLIRTEVYLFLILFSLNFVSFPFVLVIVFVLDFLCVILLCCVVFPLSEVGGSYLFGCFCLLIVNVSGNVLSSCSLFIFWYTCISRTSKSENQPFFIIVLTWSASFWRVLW